MREILFRGQTRRHGEKVKLDGDKVPGHWVYGGIFQGTGDYSVIYNINGKYAVYSDTVGQYTGLKDKNGERIFEGDIVRYRTVIGIVNWHIGCFCIKNYTTNNYYNNPAIDIILNEYPNEIEIIGNIYDNPEFLKEGAHE